MVGFTIGLYVVQLLSNYTTRNADRFYFLWSDCRSFPIPCTYSREIPYLAAWILANVIGWTLGAYLSQVVASNIFQNALPTTFTSVLVATGITGLIAGAITGLALDLDRSPARPD